LAQLPGGLVQSVDAPAPVMVGEFVDGEGRDYAMVVNLSLERSVKVFVTPGREGTATDVASVDDGRFRPIGLEAGLWLTAGQGALLRFAGV